MHLSRKHWLQEESAKSCSISFEFERFLGTLCLLLVHELWVGLMIEFHSETITSADGFHVASEDLMKLDGASFEGHASFFKATQQIYGGGGVATYLCE